MLLFPKYHKDSLKAYSFLVTGGAGFIGSHIIDYLLMYGAREVRVLDNLSTGSTKNLEHLKNNPQVIFIQKDIVNFNECEDATNGIDYVFHEAALGSVPRSITNPLKSNEVNVTGFLNIIEASKINGVKKIVYAASSSTYGDSIILPKTESIIGNPLSPYAVSKYVNELYAEVFANLYSMNIVGLRYFNVFGPRQNPKGPYAAVIPLFIKAFLNNDQPKINGDGKQTRDFTFVQNVVQANIKAMFENKDQTGHEVYNVATGHRISLLDLISMLKKISGKNIFGAHGPDRKGDVRDSLASIEKANEHFGYTPEILMQEGLDLTYNWYSENKELLS